jgi:hypothetical protein
MNTVDFKPKHCTSRFDNRASRSYVIFTVPSKTPAISAADRATRTVVNSSLSGWRRSLISPAQRNLVFFSNPESIRTARAIWENFGEPASCAVHPLLMVLTAHPQIWAGRSELIAGQWTPGLMVTTSVGTPSRPPLTGERMAERGWLLKRSYPVLKNR